jgi:hypothetical protein
MPDTGMPLSFFESRNFLIARISLNSSVSEKSSSICNDPVAAECWSDSVHFSRTGSRVKTSFLFIR